MVPMYPKTLIDPKLQGIKNAILGGIIERTGADAADINNAKHLESGVKAPFTGLSVDQCLEKAEEKVKLSHVAAGSAKLSESNDDIQMAEEVGRIGILMNRFRLN